MQNPKHAPNTPALALPGNQAPHSREAEEAVLGAVLINQDVFLSLASFLNAEDFYLLRNGYIWAAMQRLNERNDRIDFLTVGEELRGSSQLDEIGGPAYLLQLVNSTPTSTHAEVYGRLVERAAVRRRLLKAADEIKGLALDENIVIDEVTSQAETKLFGVTERNLQRELIPVRDAIDEYFARIEHLLQHPDEPLGLPTGFRDLDSLLGGLQRSDLLIFAGRPGMGKTSFLLTVALNAAKLGARIVIFTMEMGAEQIVQRLTAMETGINMQKLRLGQLDQRDWSRFVQAMGRMSNLNIFIDDTPAMTPLQMRTRCRRVQHEYGLDLVIVDYIQLMNAGPGYESNRVQEISYISRSMKELARELNVPVFSAAQLSRAVEQRQDKRPVLSDLRESGSLEQDADIVSFLYRDSVYNDAAEFPNQADVIVAKHRNGPTGTISLHFEPTQTKFTDAQTHTIDLSTL
ncbi:MAG: replicative DNA helicase [Chloroflexi bacterium]|nr:replicative DNA helicase [Chloroflexota bacterium]